MPLSLTTIERGNPPPRQKSCLGCTRAKRRCDLGRPACGRCRQRKRECHYSTPFPDSRIASHVNNTVVDEATAEFDTQAILQSNGQEASFDELSACRLDPWPMNGMDMLVPGSEGIPLDSSALECAVALENHQLDPSVLIISEPLPAPAGHESSYMPPDVEGCHTLSSYASDLVCTSIQEPVPNSFNADMWRWLAYPLGEVMKAPRTMVLDNSTPWCHPRLYVDEMPRSIQDAQACCALYLCKTATNSVTVLRTIDARVKDLVTAPLPSTPLAVLARVHALLLYQIIRLFDGDPFTRAAAEENISDLEDAAMELLPYTPMHVQCSTRSQPEASACRWENNELRLPALPEVHALWTSWVFEESARRTFCMALLLVQIYNRLVRVHLPHVCDAKLFYFCTWTASAHLWYSKDAGEFATACQKREHFSLTNSELGNMLEKAELSDIDTYGRIILTAVLGPEPIHNWFLNKGGIL